MTKDNTCSTCKHWDDTAEDRDEAVLGYCKLLEPGDYISIAFKGNIKGFEADCFVTRFDFGCNQWEEYD
jgi:hypothetical protein